MNQQQVPPQAQAMMGNYQQLQGDQAKEQWARNLAKQAGIGETELNQMIQQAQMQMQTGNAQGANAFAPPQSSPMNFMPQQGNLMNGLTQQIMGKLMGGIMGGMRL